MNIFKRFSKSKGNIPVDPQPMTVYAPLSGTAIPLSAIDDGVFSSGCMGQGCGIIPHDETVYAPFPGTVGMVSETKHAMVIVSSEGVECLIHVGLDTVDMNGAGFTSLVKQGDSVTCGQAILRFSKKAIAAAGHPDTTAVVIVNSDDYADVVCHAEGDISAGHKILSIE